MSSERRLDWKWIPWALLSGLLVFLAFRGQDLSSLLDQILDARWSWIGLSLVFSVFGLLMRSARWQMLLHAAGQKAGFWPVFVALQLGYLSNLAIPRLGEVTRCGSLYKMTGANPLSAGGTVVAERAIDLICLGLLSLTAILMAGHELEMQLRESLLAPIAELMATHALALILAGLAFLMLCAGLIWYLRHKAKSGLLRNFILSLLEGLASVFKLRRSWLFLLYTLGIWLMYAAAPVCALLALDLGGENLLELGFFAFVVGSLARTLPLPGGSAGAYHLAVGQVLIAYGHAAQQALGLASLNHLAQTLLQLGLGLLAALAFIFLSRKPHSTT